MAFDGFLSSDTGPFVLIPSSAKTDTSRIQSDITSKHLPFFPREWTYLESCLMELFTKWIFHDWGGISSNGHDIVSTYLNMLCNIWVQNPDTVMIYWQHPLFHLSWIKFLWIFSSCMHLILNHLAKITNSAPFYNVLIDQRHFSCPPRCNSLN